MSWSLFRQGQVPTTAVPTTGLCYPAQNGVSYEDCSREGVEEVLSRHMWYLC